MRADPADQRLLLDIQARDISLSQLAAKLRALESDPEHAQLTAHLHEARTLLRDQLALADSVGTEVQRAESDVSMVQARIDRDTERVEHTSSAKDAQGLSHELQTLHERKATLEEVQLELMERLESAQREAAETSEEVVRLEAALEQTTARTTQARESMQREMDEIRNARAECAQRVPAELLALYERQRERYGYGASHLQGGVTSASGVVLTESDLATIRQAASDDVILCPDSNAILVRTEHSGL